MTESIQSFAMGAESGRSLSSERDILKRDYCAFLYDKHLLQTPAADDSDMKQFDSCRNTIARVSANSEDDHYWYFS